MYKIILLLGAILAVALSKEVPTKAGASANSESSGPGNTGTADRFLFGHGGHGGYGGYGGYGGGHHGYPGYGQGGYPGYGGGYPGYGGGHHGGYPYPPHYG